MKKIPIAIRLASEALTVGAYTAQASFSVLKCALKTLRVVENLFATYDVRFGGKIEFRTGCIEVPFDEADNLQFGNMHHAMTEALKQVDTVKTRFGNAYSTQTPLPRTEADRRALTFNKAIFQFQNQGGTCVFLPESDAEHQFTPAEPRLLDCEEPSNIRIVRIQGALISGARDANGKEHPLPFQGATQVDAVLSLIHDIAEVIFTTSLDVAQNLWKKATRVTCDVEIAPGKIPRVIGNPTFICNDD
jgi:hypothetical protein